MEQVGNKTAEKERVGYGLAIFGRGRIAKLSWNIQRGKRAFSVLRNENISGVGQTPSCRRNTGRSVVDFAEISVCVSCMTHAD
jgi:hypothetical protein